MKRLLLIFTLLFSIFGDINVKQTADNSIEISLVSCSSAQIAAVSTATVTAGGAGATTSSINSTGGSTIILTLGYHTSTTPTVSDSKGSTWVQIIDAQTNPSASSGSRAYYCNPCVFGTGHTFTTGAHFALYTVTVLSGTATGNPVDQTNSNVATSNATILPGSITPTVAGSYVFVTACNFNGTAPTAPAGYTLIGNCTTATAEAGVAAYKSLAGTSAENPTIGAMTAGNPQSSIIFNIKPASTAVSNDCNEVASQTY